MRCDILENRLLTFTANVLSGTWVNAYWIGSALGGFAVGHILSILCSPIKGDDNGNANGMFPLPRSNFIL